jgi:Putative Flp pilus-assembly TadE/G-like
MKEADGKRTGPARLLALRALRREDGQSLVLLVLCMVVLLGMLGLVVDVGQLYITKHRLQTAADAAALSAAQDLPNGSVAEETACTYSASPGSARGTTCTGDGGAIDLSSNGENYHTTLAGVQTTAQLECLSVDTAGTSCVTGSGCPGASYPPSGRPGCNAIKVTETTSVEPYVMGVLGFGARTVSASSTASMAGGAAVPLDIEVVLDSTASMADSDNCGASGHTSGVTGIPYGDVTAEDCAKAGVRGLLETLYPCALTSAESLTTCGPTSDGNVVNAPQDEVGLMTFPPLVGNPSETRTKPLYVDPGGSGLGVPVETNCTTDVSDGQYFSSSPSNYAAAQDPNYTIVPLASDYKASDATTPANDSLLDAGSNLVKSVYWGQCPGGVYPANGGSGETTSITQSGTSVATNAGGIGGGPGTSSNLSAKSNTSGITSAGTKPFNNGTSAISGGPDAGAAYDTQTTTTASVGGALTINPGKPGGAGGANDILIATVAVKSSTIAICAPSGWTAIGGGLNSVGSGTGEVVQESFWAPSSVSSTAFALRTTTGCATNATVTAASAIIARYGGLDAGSPIDASKASTSSSAGTALTSPDVSAQETVAGDEVVHLYATNDTGFSAGQDVASGIGAYDDVGVAAWGAANNGTATSKHSASWIGQTVALKPAAPPSSVSIASLPAGTANGDFLLVSVTARGLGTTGGICAPNGNWAQVGSSSTSGTGAGSVTEATFYRIYNSATDTLPFTFTFRTSAGGSCSGTAFATAIIARYTGVASANQIDTGTNGAVRTGSGTTLTAPSGSTTPSYSTTAAGDEVVVLYGTGSPSITQTEASSPGYVTSSGIEDSVQDAPGPIAANTATGSSSDNWTARTVALEPSLPSSLVLPSPQAATYGDFLLATVTARGLGATGGVCAPSGWTQVGSSSTSPTSGGGGSVTEATFWKFYAGSDTVPYSFSFESSPGGPCTATAAATGIIVRYTGVNPQTPIDPGTTGIPAAKTGSGTTLTAPGSSAPQYTTTANGDQIVQLYGTGSTTLTGTATTQTGYVTSSGLEDEAQAAAGTVPAEGATGTSDNWSARTVALEPVPITSVSVARPGTPAVRDVDIVTVTARATGSGGSGVICAPTASTDPDGDSWTLVHPAGLAGEETYPTTAGSSQITHATFWSVRSSGSPESFPFTFRSGSCAGPSISDAATAVAVDYTGVEVVAPGPVDDNGDPSEVGVGVTAYATGSSRSLSAPSVATSYFNDEVIHTYGTAYSALTGVSIGEGETGTYPSATGFEDDGAAGDPGTSGTGSAGTSSSAGWIADTLALVPADGGCVAGGGGSGDCTYGLEDPGGAGTYYAKAITAAKTALDSVPASRASTQQVIILLSDGVASQDVDNDSKPCQDGILNAEQAEDPGAFASASSGAWVFAIAYGQSTDSCPDTTGIASSRAPITGLCAMHLIADNPYSDPAYAGQSLSTVASRVCTGAQDSDPAHRFYNEPSDSDLATVFKQIGTTLGEPRLVSGNAT